MQARVSSVHLTCCLHGCVQDKLRRRREQQLLAVLGLAPAPTGSGAQGRDRTHTGADGSGGSDAGSSCGAGVSGSGSGMPPPPPGSSHVTSALTAAGVDPVTAALVASTLGLGNLSTETLAAVAQASASGGKLQQPSAAGTGAMYPNTTTSSVAPIRGLGAGMRAGAGAEGSLRHAEESKNMWGMTGKHSVFLDQYSSEALSPRHVAEAGRGGGGGRHRPFFGPASLAQGSYESGRRSTYSRGSGMGMAGGSGRWQYGGLDRLHSPVCDKPYIDLGLGRVGMVGASSVEQGGYTHTARGGVAGGSPLAAQDSDAFSFMNSGRDSIHASEHAPFTPNQGYGHGHGHGHIRMMAMDGTVATSPAGSDSDNPLVPAPVLVYVPPMPVVTASQPRSTSTDAPGAQPATDAALQRPALTTAVRQAAVNMSGGVMMECGSTSTGQAASVLNSLAAFANSGTAGAGAVSTAPLAAAPLPPLPAHGSGLTSTATTAASVGVQPVASVSKAEDILKAVQSGIVNIHAAVQAYRAGVIGNALLMEAVMVCAAKDAHLATQVVSTLPPALQVAFVLHLGQQQARGQVSASTSTGGARTGMAPADAALSGGVGALAVRQTTEQVQTLPAASIKPMLSAPTRVPQQTGSGALASSGNLAPAGRVVPPSHLHLPSSAMLGVHHTPPPLFQHHRTCLSGDLVPGPQQASALFPHGLSGASAEDGHARLPTGAVPSASLGREQARQHSYMARSGAAPLHTPFPHSPVATGVSSSGVPLYMGGGQHPAEVALHWPESPLAALLQGSTEHVGWRASMYAGGSPLPSVHSTASRNAPTDQQDGAKSHRSGHFLRDRGGAAVKTATRYPSGRPLMQDTAPSGPVPLADHEFDMSALQDLGESQAHGVDRGAGSTGQHQQVTIQQAIAALGPGLHARAIAPAKPKTRSSPSTGLPLKPTIVSVLHPVHAVAATSGPPGGSDRGEPASPAATAFKDQEIPAILHARSQEESSRGGMRPAPLPTALLSNGAAAAPPSPSASHSTASGGPRVGMPPRLQLKALAMQTLQAQAKGTQQGHSAAAALGMPAVWAREPDTKAQVQEMEETARERADMVSMRSGHNKRRKLE